MIAFDNNDYALEKKVEAIVSKMNDLQRQNVALQEKNRDLIEKNSLLMQKISSFEADQNRIEQGILNALDRLNSMENSALKVGTSATTQNVQEVVPSNTENVTEETSAVKVEEDKKDLSLIVEDESDKNVEEQFFEITTKNDSDPVKIELNKYSKAIINKYKNPSYGSWECR